MPNRPLDRPELPRKEVMRSIKKLPVELVAVAISVLLSIWLVYSDNVINGDGVLYLKSAEAFANGNWQEGVNIYRWPLYAALIGGLHYISGLETDVVAYVLNGALYALLVWTFLSIVKFFGADRRTLWIAAILILALPSLNSYRAFIIRDVGYWAFYLLGLSAFFRFQRNPRLHTALGFGAAMTVATLFRIEGIVFLVFMPLVVLCRSGVQAQKTLAQFAKLNIVLILDVIAVASWFAARGPAAFAGRLHEPWMQLKAFGGQLSGGLLAKADALGQSVLNEYSDDFAVSSVIIILLVMLLTYIVKSVGLLGAFAAGYACATRAVSLEPVLRRSLAVVILLNIAVLVVFIASTFFLTGRFVLSLALAVLLLAPFGLNRLYERWRSPSRKRWEALALPIALLLLLIMIVDSLWSFGTSKAYLKEAGMWLRLNTPAHARIYSESTVTGFYAQKSGDEWRHTTRTVADVQQAGKLQTYDYVAVALRRGESVPSSFGSTQAVKEFKNEKNDRVLIFRAEDLPSVP